jgi:hypothetical protein
LPWNGGRAGIRANSAVRGSIEETEGLKRLADPAQKELLINAVSLRRTGTLMQRPICLRSHPQFAPNTAPD